VNEQFTQEKSSPFYLKYLSSRKGKKRGLTLAGNFSKKGKEEGGTGTLRSGRPLDERKTKKEDSDGR